MNIIKVPVTVDERILVPIQVDEYKHGRESNELKTRFSMKDKITFIADLSNSIGGNSLVRNYGFEKEHVHEWYPADFGGNWDYKPNSPRAVSSRVPFWREKISSKNKNNQYAAGTYSTLYLPGNPIPDSCSVVSSPIAITGGTRFKLSIDFSVRDGYLVYKSNVTPPKIPKTVSVKSYNTNRVTVVDVPEPLGPGGWEIRSMNIRPIYGALVSWFDSSDTHILTEVAIVKRGGTMLNNDLPPGDDELPTPRPVKPPVYLEGDIRPPSFSPEIGSPIIGVPDFIIPEPEEPPSRPVYNPGVWKTFSSVIVSPANASFAKVEIFSVPIEILPRKFIERADSKIYFDNINLQGHGPFLEIRMPTNDNALLMDSKSYMTVLSPDIKKETIVNEWDTRDASPLFAATGSKEPLSLPKDLKFGNEDDANIWQSWIPFSCDFSSLTGGARIKKATLIFTASASTPIIPTDISSIAKGFESSLEIKQPTDWDSLKGKTIRKLTSENLIHTWVAGEQYEIDVTESAKSLFGQEAIQWDIVNGMWRHAAIMLRDNGSTKRALRSIAGPTHPIYPSPKLKVEYTYNHYDNKMFALVVNKHPDRKNINHASTTWKHLIIGRKKDGEAEDISRGQLWFDLSSIPSNEIVESARLCLYHLGSHSNPNGGKLEGRAFLKKWDWKGSTWLKQFGTKGWTTPGAGTEDVSSTKMFDFAGPFPENDWIRIPIEPATINSWRTSPQTNYGIQLKHSSEETGGFFFYGQFFENAGARPVLIVESESGNQYRIFDDSDYGTLPEPDNPPEEPIEPIKRPVTMVGTPHMEYNRPSVGWSHTIEGEENTNRFLLVFAPHEGTTTPKDTSQNYLTTLKYGDMDMTHICNGHNEPNPVLVNKAQIVAWGLAIPNDLPKGTTLQFSGNAPSNDYIALYIMEFVGVNSESPVYQKHSGRNNSASAKQYVAGGFNLEVLPNGQIITGIALSNGDVDFKTLVPMPENSQTVLHRRKHGRTIGLFGASSLSNVPETSTITYNLNWKWAKTDADPTNNGSWSALVAISLNPMQ